MTDVLNVWADGRHVGVFSRASGATRFEYDADVTSPISLSLPIGGGQPSAAEAFLQGLLPEGEVARLRMRHGLGAASTDSFDLLDSVDSAGGLVFSSSSSDPEVSEALVPMQPEDLEALCASVAGSGAAWWEADERMRFSLAGAQGKFTATCLSGDWYWPSASLPSTHIFKPESARIADVAYVECACMRLASRCGLTTPRSTVARLAGTSVYVVERFDREASGDGVARLRTEDLCQALGVMPSEKYEVSMGDVIGLFRRSGLPSDEVYSWVTMVGFNVLVGNADAHAKNYSLYETDAGPRLCPLYDCVTTSYWDGFDRALAMSVNGKWYPEEIGLDDWAREAQADGLDPERVRSSVRDLAARIVEETPLAMEGIPKGVALRLGPLITRFPRLLMTGEVPRDPGEATR